MSAPDSPNSRTPPSLLSDTAATGEANGSRILANLEGRVVPPAEKKPQRAKKPLVAGALLVVALAAVGAWQLQGRYSIHPAGAAQGDAAVTTAATAGTTAAAPASGANVSVSVASGSAAPVAATNPASGSVSQAATIVADDSASASPGAASSPEVASASGAVDDNRLSRALANGAEDTNAPASSITLAAAPAKNVKSAAANSKRHETAASRSKHEAANADHHAARQTAVAQTKPHDAKSGKAHDDSDADLLAALVARTKPSTEAGKAAPLKSEQLKKSSAKSASAKEGSKEAPTKVAASTNAGDVRLAERVKECGQKGFFEDQLCRWRVCDGHWGKDPACPSAATTRQP